VDQLKKKRDRQEKRETQRQNDFDLRGETKEMNGDGSCPELGFPFFGKF